MDRAFESDMAETIGFAARRLGSAIVSIATMRMSEVARAAVVTRPVPHATCLREEYVGTRQKG